MRAIKPEGIKVGGGKKPRRILSADNLEIYVKTKVADGMSTPAIMTANLAKFKQSQSAEKANKKKEAFKNKIRKEGITDPLTLGDNFDVCNPYESTTKDVKELTRPWTAGRSRSHAREQLILKENAPQQGELCKRCSTPGEHNKAVEKFDEGFYDEEQNTKLNVIEEVKELIRKSESQKSDPSDNSNRDLIHNSCSSSDKPKKRIWIAVLVWVFTFTGALVFYFALFVYTYKYEPFYSNTMVFVGWEDQPPPPPLTMKEEVFQALDQLSRKLYNVHLFLMEMIASPFQNKS